VLIHGHIEMFSDMTKDQQLSENDGFTDFAKNDPSTKNKKNQDSNLKITIHLDLVAEVDIKIKAQLYGDIVIGLL
jgi:hypothetical protein